MLWFLIQRVQNNENFIKAQLTVLCRLAQTFLGKIAIEGLSPRFQPDLKCSALEPGFPSWQPSK